MNDLITNLFEDIALTLGGLLAVHDVPDDFVGKFCLDLERLHARVLMEVRGTHAGTPHATSTCDFTPHPAVERLLERIQGAGRRRGSEGGES